MKNKKAQIAEGIFSTFSWPLIIFLMLIFLASVSILAINKKIDIDYFNFEKKEPNIENPLIYEKAINFVNLPLNNKRIYEELLVYCDSNLDENTKNSIKEISDEFFKKNTIVCINNTYSKVDCIGKASYEYISEVNELFDLIGKSELRCDANKKLILEVYF